MTPAEIVAVNTRAQGSEIKRCALNLGVEPAALHAIIAVECGEIPAVQGLPVIRFEVHVALKKYPGFSAVLELRDPPPAWHKDAQWCRVSQAHPWARVHTDSQSSEWAALSVASAVSPIALECASYGVGQIMGFHWGSLGYASVQEFVADAMGGIPRQLDQLGKFLRYNSQGKILAALKAKNWDTVALIYNGSGQVAAYSAALSRAYLP